MMSIVQCDNHLESIAWKLEQNIRVKGRRYTLEQNVMFALFLALETILGLLHGFCADSRLPGIFSNAKVPVD
ncbi:hypothetical protein ACFX2J_008368 [Malus domestica]